MEDSQSEIIELGRKTLEKFLLLLKEDEKLRLRTKQKIVTQRKDNFEKIKEFRKNISTSQPNENSEYLIAADNLSAITELIKEEGKLSESEYLASNAYFVYLFAIFDQYLLSVIKKAFKNNQTVKDNFKNYCLNYYEKTKDKKLFKVLPFEEKLIDFLPNLPSAMHVASNILDINFKDERFIDHYFRLVEMRERRNLLVHRSGKGDDIYFKSIKYQLSTISQKKFNSFTQKLKSNLNKELKIEPRYFMRSVETMYFFVCLISNFSLNKNYKTDEKINLFTEPFHDLLIFILNNQFARPLLNIVSEFTFYLIPELDEDLALIDDIAKVNWILLNEAQNEYRLYLMKKLEKFASNKIKDGLSKTEKEDYKKNFSDAAEETSKLNILLLKNIQDPLVKATISSYLDKNHTKYIECISKFIDNGYSSDIESWYMHIKLSEDREFKEKYSDFKNKKNYGSKKLKIKLPYKTNNKTNKN